MIKYRPRTRASPPKKNKKNMEDVTEVTAEKVEEVDTTAKTAELNSAPKDENHSVGNQTGKEKKTTTPTETLRETLERQRQTTDLIMNKNPGKRQSKQEKPPEVGTIANCETAPPLKPPVQYGGGNQTQTLIPSWPGKEDPRPARATPSDTDFSYPRTPNSETEYFQ